MGTTHEELATDLPIGSNVRVDRKSVSPSGDTTKVVFLGVLTRVGHECVYIDGGCLHVGLWTDARGYVQTTTVGVAS